MFSGSLPRVLNTKLGIFPGSPENLSQQMNSVLPSTISSDGCLLMANSVHPSLLYPHQQAQCFAHSRHQQIFALIKLLDWVQKSEGWYTIYKRKLTFIVSFVPSIELGISIYYSKY